MLFDLFGSRGFVGAESSIDKIDMLLSGREVDEMLGKSLLSRKGGGGGGTRDMEVGALY